MIRATIDPGSAVVAVLIYDDAAPGYVARYLDARPFEVGVKVAHDPPLLMRYADKTAADGTVTPGNTWLKKFTRTVTEADERDVAIGVVAYLIGRVEEVTIERVGQAHGKTLGEVISKSGQLVKTARIASGIAARCDALGIVVRPGPLAVTWRARLVPLVREHGGDVAGPAIRGKGAALDPVLAAKIEGWPDPRSWDEDHVDHIRVVGGMALWSLLPPLPGTKRKADGPRRPRVSGGGKRAPKGGKGGRYPRGARARAKMSAAERDRSCGVDRARYARTIGADLAAARVASGCNCKPPEKPTRGRHKATCPAHKGPPATCRVCYRPIAAHSRPCAG